MKQGSGPRSRSTVSAQNVTGIFGDELRGSLDLMFDVQSGGSVLGHHVPLRRYYATIVQVIYGRLLLRRYLRGELCDTSDTRACTIWQRPNHRT